MEGRSGYLPARIRAGTTGSEPDKPRSISLPLAFPNSELPTNISALVDTGATDSFVGSDFAVKHSLPLIKLPQPINLTLFDGKPANSGPVTHFVNIEFDSAVSGPAELPFLVTKLPSEQPIVLGYDFLRTFDPVINWQEGTLCPRSQSRNLNSESRSQIRTPNSGSTSD